MKLIDLLVKELPRRGGWPCGVDAVEQDCEGQLFEMESDYCSDFKLEKCDDWIADVVTKQQYESALAASEGWIEWHGGRCPVDNDAIVEVRYRKPSPLNFNNDRAGDFSWSHDGFGGDIIAYRLHDQGINARANDDRLEKDLNECIGQDVAAEWDGEGLPPVGCECEVSVDGGNTWCSYKALNEKNGMRLVEIGNFTEDFQSNNWTFRPINSEADKKREEAINKIQSHCHVDHRAPISSGQAIALYDAIAAGKIPGIKLEGK